MPHNKPFPKNNKAAVIMPVRMLRELRIATI